MTVFLTKSVYHLNLELLVLSAIVVTALQSQVLSHSDAILVNTHLVVVLANFLSFGSLNSLIRE